MRAGPRTAVLALLVAAGAAPAAAQSDGGPVLTLDAALTGTFDRNIGRDRAELNGYGGAGELLLRLATGPSRPLLQLEYATSLRRSSEVNPADGAGHRVSGLAGVPVAQWLRLDVIGRAGRGGVDDDLAAADELVLLGRLALQPGRSSRLRTYGARRWREPPPGVAPTLEQYAGIELRQRLGASTAVLVDARYEQSRPPDTTRFWHRAAATLGIAQHVARHTAVELDVRHRQRRYPRRLLEVDDTVAPRRDDDWRIGLALVYDDARGTELRLEAEQEERASNDPLRGYDAGRLNLTLRRRVFGLGGLRPPPRIDERVATEALRAHSEESAREAPVFTALAVGGTGVCALDAGRAAICWPLLSNAASALPSATVHGAWTHVAAGPGRACALDKTGAAYCWSWHEGATGSASAAAVTPPQPVRTELRFMTLSVGGEHVCGLTADAAAYCWGDNAEGQLGTGTARPSATPVRVAASAPFRSISAGGRHTCALTMDDALYCWGANESSQAAAGAARRMLLPRLVEGFRFAALAAGTRHTCALTADGRAWCWGENAGGQTGQPGGGQVVQPWLVQAPGTFTTIGAGWAHSCALDSHGKVWCWGRNSYGQLGTGRADDEAHPDPRPVAADRAFSALAVSFRTCALDLSQTLYCWGAGLGTDSAGAALAPAPLRLPTPRRRR